MLTKLTQLKNHSGFMRYLQNTSWMMGEKILRMFVGLFVGIWIARYLGPEQFGLLSYAQSFVGLFAAIATLGLDGVVIRELVNNPAQRDKLMGSAFVLKLIGAILILPLLALAVQFTSNDQYTNLLVFLIASATIFQSFNVIDFYYQANVQSKYIALANTISLGISSLIKIALVLNEAPLMAFACMVIFDSAVLTLGLIYFYKKNSPLKLVNWVFEIQTATYLIKESWLMMLAGAAILIYMKIDQVMIKEMMSDEAVGVYAAAARISEAWYFIPMTIANSLYPAILNAKKVNEELFYDRLQKLYSLMVWIAIIIAVPVTLLSDLLVTLLYGNPYIQAGNVLMIHIWSGVFVFLSVANDKWFYSLGKPGLLALKVSVGAIANVLINYYFIPLYGIYGAAMATLISYSISVVFSDLLFISLWRLFKMKIKAILLYPLIISLMKKNEM